MGFCTTVLMATKGQNKHESVCERTFLKCFTNSSTCTIEGKLKRQFYKHTDIF